ncbi:MAG TPA: hypothetical protein VIJ57_09310 [Hanamia sp.]
MEQNNFEKDIHGKLEELKIDPSDSVWKNVQEHIVKKEKKRRILFLLFFLFLLISLAGYWLFNSNANKQERNVAIAKTSMKESKPTNKPDSSFNRPAINPGILSNPGSIKEAYGNKKNKAIRDEKNKSKQDEKHIPDTKEAIFSTESRKDSSKATNNPESHFITDKPKNSSIENEQVVTAKTNKETTILQKENKNDSLQNPTELEINNSKTVTKNDLPIKKHSKKDQKHPWTFGITFSGGRSFITGNHSAMNNVYSSPSSNSNSGGIPGFYPVPSELKNSSAFFVGAILEKNISGINEVSFGISYQYFSLENKVGTTLYPSTALQYLNSSGNLYSGNNITRTYINKFHFLEIPVTFNFRLNKNKSVPLFWNAGINISELITSNALQFQTNPGVYYNDNSFFNKTQFGLHTGFSVTVFSKEKTPLSIGPYFYYSPSNVANKGLYTKTHFNYFGLETKILFRKK